MIRPLAADILLMKASLVMKHNVRCAYMNACYLHEAQECFGFKTDCPLYMRSNGEPCSEVRFHAAMDRLIVRTKTKHDVANREQQAADQSSEKPSDSLAKPPASS